MSDDRPPQPGFKKKNKKSFLQKAKKFGRQGRRGQGHEIGQDQYDYLVRVLERWRQGFDDDEEKDIFVKNVFDQTVDQEKDLSRNQLASRVLELLMSAAPESIQQNFRQALATDLRIVCTDSFASHVVQKLLLLAAFSPLPVDGEAGALVTRTDWIIKVAKFVINNMAEFSRDTYASHIVRTLAQCLAGTRLPQELVKSRRAQQQVMSSKAGVGDNNMYQLSGDSRITEVMQDAVDKLVELEVDVCRDELGSGVMQTFLLVTQHNKQITKAIVKCLLTGCLKFDNEQIGLADIWEHESLVRLIETVVQVVQPLPKLRAKVFSRLLSGKLCALSVHPSGNYVVQRLLDHCLDITQFEQSWTELGSHLSSILGAGCTGVVLSLTKAARRLNSCQTSVLSALVTAFHCDSDPDMFACLLLRMVTREAFSEQQKEFPIHIHGSLALQELLQFQKPIKIVNSLLSMEPSKLRQVFSDPRGCHVTDVFVQSETIGEKSREALVKTLKGEFTALACNKHGSRSLDSIWAKVSLKNKRLMVEELAQKEAQLNSNQFGKFVSLKCAISVWKHSNSDWNSVVTSTEKKENLFSDILGDNIKITKRKAEEKSNPVVEKKPKKEVADLVQELFNNDKEKLVPEVKKKKKMKSYLDDL